MNSDLKSHLRELHITAAKEVEVGQGKKAIVIFMPVPQVKAFQKIQTRLVRELEKKFSGKHVVFIAQRRILPKPTRKANKLKQKRPRSRTLLAVHNSILDDLVYPAEIVGKRIRIRLDGSRSSLSLVLTRSTECQFVVFTNTTLLPPALNWLLTKLRFPPVSMTLTSAESAKSV